MFLFALALLAVLVFIAKDLLFWLYVLQLKEYRRDKLKDFFVTAEGYKTIFSKKNALRLIMAIGIVMTMMLATGSPAWEFLKWVVTCNIICIMIFIDIIPFVLAWKHKKIKQPEWTKRILMVIFATMTIVFCLPVLLMLKITNEVELPLSFMTNNIIIILNITILILCYSLFVQLFLPLLTFLSHLVIFPIAWLEKKRILSAAMNKIQAMPHLTTIGISGSYGKSSVKMLLAHLLSQQVEDHQADYLLTPPGNINTELGISQYILNKLRPIHHYFVTEFGTYKIGESKLIGEIVDQKIGFLTGLNNQHVGLFGSVANAIEAETEILIKLREHNGTIYANRDDHLVRSVSFGDVRLVKYSITDPTADAYIVDIAGEPGKYEFTLHYNGKAEKLKNGKAHESENSGAFEPLSLGTLSFRTDLIGRHNLLNLAGVLACCLDQGIPYEILYEHCKRLAQFQKTLHISQLLTPNSQLLTCIDDTYNINQNGVKAGLDLLSEYKGKKIVFIDEIIELGDETAETHRQLGQTLAQYELDAIYLTGKNYGHYIEEGLKESGKAEKLEGGQELIIKNIATMPLGNFETLLLGTNPTTILFLGRGTQVWLEQLKNSGGTVVEK